MFIFSSAEDNFTLFYVNKFEPFSTLSVFQAESFCNEEENLILQANLTSTIQLCNKLARVPLDT